MDHPTYRVIECTATGPHSLRVKFDDGFVRDIDLKEVLAGDIYGPLKDSELFAAVEVDPEIHTVVWPNGADFDPETLYNWPKYEKSMRDMARRWAAAESAV
jgi:hypothetical protein